MRRTTLGTILLAAAAAGAGGCIIDAGDDLRITELRVTGESDFGLLDVEVHLFDGLTREHLGCSGEYEGLEHVDYNDVTYHLDAWFREPWADHEVRPWMLDGRLIEIQVVEDDVARCPDPPSIEDDMIGISPMVDRRMFERAPTLAFDHVMELRITIE